MCTTPDSLRAAMIGYQAGDACAFESLYAALAPPLRRYLRRLGGESAALDDLVQDTFLQLHRARRTYDPALPVTPWAFAIARHTFLVDCRRRRRRFASMHEPLDGDVCAAAGRDERTLTAAITVRSALAMLAPGTRVSLVLHDIEGLNCEEIAGRLRVQATAVRARVSRGRRRLRRQLQQIGGSTPRARQKPWR